MSSGAATPFSLPHFETSPPDFFFLLTMESRSYFLFTTWPPFPNQVLFQPVDTPDVVLDKVPLQSRSSRNNMSFPIFNQISAASGLAHALAVIIV